MKEKQKRVKGISLIVLIVTIVVIIILSSIAIISVANNKPVEIAKEVTELHNKSVLLESAGVLSAEWKTDSLLEKTALSRNEYVKKKLEEQGFTEEQIRDIVVSEQTGRVGEKGGAVDIANNPDKYYGKVVDYRENSESDVEWKIFYSDESNIYLIAGDYIPYVAVPTNLKGHRPAEVVTGSNDNQYTSDIQFAGILEDYTGSESITDVKLQNLNSSYFAYLRLINNKRENDSIKAVAYMLDTDAWKVFKGDNAEYAIGGPTSELFIKSYRQKYPQSALECKVVGVNDETNGYRYRNDSSGIWNTYVASAFDTSDSLYVITDKIKGTAMWLASTSDTGRDGLSVINCTGGLSYAHCRGGIGVRFSTYCLFKFYC